MPQVSTRKGEHSKNENAKTALNNDKAVAVKPDVTQCLPHHHIMFIKTHKCASSTINVCIIDYDS